MRVGDYRRTRGLAPVDLVPAVVADARVEDGRLGRFIQGNGDIAGRVEEREFGGVEEWRSPAGTISAEDTAAFPAVLWGDRYDENGGQKRMMEMGD